MVQDWQLTTSQVSSEDYAKDQWAYRLLCEYMDARRKLRKLYQEYTERIEAGEEVLSGDREWIGSMLNELTEVIPMIATYCSADQLGLRERRWVYRLQRIAHVKRARLHVWDPEWLQRLADSRDWEEEVIAKLDGDGKDDGLTIDFGLPRRQREALELVAAGLSYERAAELCGIQKGSLSKHLQLARRKFAGDSAAAQLAWNFE